MTSRAVALVLPAALASGFGAFAACGSPGNVVGSGGSDAGHDVTFVEASAFDATEPGDAAAEGGDASGSGDGSNDAGDSGSTVDGSGGDGSQCTDQPPTFHPSAPLSSHPFTVTLSLPITATICYTLDGSEPACGNGACEGTALTYAGGIAIDATKTQSAPAGEVTVRAAACVAGCSGGPEGQQTYTLELAQPYLASGNAAGEGLPGWDWSGAGAPFTSMTIPADAGAPYGPFTATQVGSLPCAGPATCTGTVNQVADFLCWAKGATAGCDCASPIALASAAPVVGLPSAADPSPGDSLSIIACQSTPPVNAPGYYASSPPTTVQF